MNTWILSPVLTVFRLGDSVIHVPCFCISFHPEMKPRQSEFVVELRISTVSDISQRLNQKSSQIASSFHRKTILVLLFLNKCVILSAAFHTSILCYNTDSRSTRSTIFFWGEGRLEKKKRRTCTSCETWS